MAKQFDLNKKTDFLILKNHDLYQHCSAIIMEFIWVKSLLSYCLAFALHVRQFALVNCRQHLFPVIQLVKLLRALLLPVTVGMLSHG